MNLYRQAMLLQYLAQNLQHLAATTTAKRQQLQNDNKRTKTMRELESIKQYLRKFAKDRDWEKFHSPKNLSMALSVEAAELVEIFQWLSEEQSHNLDAQKKADAADEIADILIYLIRIADQLNIDIADAVSQKTQKNEKKYPADLVRGSKKKYTEY